jgi:hypothetical protein
VHPTRLIALRHFLMNDAAAGRHPLNIASADRATVTETIAMLDRADEHVRDRFDAPMRVPGKARQVVFRDVIAKVVEQQEGIVVGRSENSWPFSRTRNEGGAYQ